MTPASSVHQPAALARAFLALTDGDPTTPPRAFPPMAVVLLAAIVLAMSSPLLWAGLVDDGPDAAATTPPRIALVEGDDEAPGGR